MAERANRGLPKSDGADPAAGVGDGPYRALTFAPRERLRIPDAIASAARAAGRFGMREATFRASVTRVEKGTTQYTRALYRIERRTIVRRTTPGVGPAPAGLRAAPSGARLDPWGVTQAALAANPPAPARCPSCRARSVGTASTGAPVANPCPTCDGTGWVTAWLVLETTSSTQVRVHPAGPATELHVGVAEAADFDSGRNAWKNELVLDLCSDTRGETLPGVDLAAPLRPSLDERTDRVRGVRVQTFASESCRVGYATAISAGVIDVSGDPPAVAPSTSFAPLIAWRSLTIAGTIIGLTLAFFAASSYKATHPHGARETLILLLGGAAGVLASIAGSGFALIGRARTARETWLPLGLAAVCAAATAAVWIL